MNRKNFVIFIVIVFFAKNLLAFDVHSFIALSKQKSLLNHADIISNNIANAETTGFKEYKMIEQQKLVFFSNKKGNTYNNDISVVKNMQDGGFVRTDNSLNMAIAGDAFFIVQTPNGIRYTKNGNFTLSNEGMLVTVNGYSVLNNANAPIIFPANTNEIIFTRNGEIIVNEAEFAEIGIAKFDNSQLLAPEGQSLLKYTGDNAHRNANDNEFQLLQGFLESSNTNKIQQLTNLMEVQRDVGQVTSLLNTYDELSRSVIAKMGKS